MAKTRKIELGKASYKTKNIVQNADAGNLEKVGDHYFIYIGNIVYKIHQSKLNEFQRQKLELHIREKKHYLGGSYLPETGKQLSKAT